MGKRPALIVTARIGEHVIKANGREARALVELINAGEAGITSLDMGKAGWAYRLAAYVGDLRKMGVPIVTEREDHEGGNHARYKLSGAVTILTRSDIEKEAA